MNISNICSLPIVCCETVSSLAGSGYRSLSGLFSSCCFFPSCDLSSGAVEICGLEIVSETSSSCLSGLIRLVARCFSVCFCSTDVTALPSLEEKKSACKDGVLNLFRVFNPNVSGSEVGYGLGGIGLGETIDSMRRSPMEAVDPIHMNSTVVMSLETLAKHKILHDGTSLRTEYNDSYFCVVPLRRGEESMYMVTRYSNDYEGDRDSSSNNQTKALHDRLIASEVVSLNSEEMMRLRPRIISGTLSGDLHQLIENDNHFVFDRKDMQDYEFHFVDFEEHNNNGTIYHVKRHG